MERDKAINLIIDEHNAAIVKFPPFYSAHEGYAVLLEEVRELESEVFKNQKVREKRHMEKEAKQVAAMALRFLVDCC